MSERNEDKAIAVTYRAKPSLVSAWRWPVELAPNQRGVPAGAPCWVTSVWNESAGRYGIVGNQGWVAHNAGDWIIRELNGNGAYPCAPKIFAAKYEEIAPEAYKSPDHVPDRTSDPRIELSSMQARGDTRLFICDTKPNKAYGYALMALTNGFRVRRAGWNGKGMWLAYVGPDDYAIHGGVLAPRREREIVPDLLPWIGMRTADAKFVPWLASQTDMLATDWGIVT